jgi:hypothetical protein
VRRLAGAEAQRNELHRLDRVALGLRLVHDPSQVPGLVREGHDPGNEPKRLGAACVAEARERGRLVGPPDPLQALARRGRQMRPVGGASLLIEVHPPRVRCDLDQAREETGAVDTDLALRDLGGHERQPTLVLLPAEDLPAAEHERHQEEERCGAHAACIGAGRRRP